MCKSVRLKKAYFKTDQGYTEWNTLYFIAFLNSAIVYNEYLLNNGHT